MMNIEKIERTRSMLRDSAFADSWRDLTVTYIFGTTGVGKTRSVMDKFGYRNCYRVTDYKHPSIPTTARTCLFWRSTALSSR